MGGGCGVLSTSVEEPVELELAVFSRVCSQLVSGTQSCFRSMRLSDGILSWTVALVSGAELRGETAALCVSYIIDRGRRHTGDVNLSWSHGESGGVVVCKKTRALEKAS